MKIPIIITLLVVGAAAGMGWRNHRRWEIARAEHETLVSKAADKGISLASLSSPGRMPTSSGRRETRKTGEALGVEEFATFGKEFGAELERMINDGEVPDGVARTRYMEIAGRLKAADAKSLRALASQLRSDSGIDDSIRRTLILWAMQVLAIGRPHTALDLFSDSYDLLKGARMSDMAIVSPMRNWAMDDPVAAAGWVEEIGGKHPELVSEYAKSELIAGAACNDPGLAFQLIAKLGFAEPGSAFVAVVRAATTPQGRTACLSGLRSYLGDHADAKSRASAKRAMVSLAAAAAGDGFESGSRWITESKLPPDVLQRIPDHLVLAGKNGTDTGRWIEWFGQTIQPETGSRIIGNLAAQWTRDNPQAAGNWLVTAPDGPAKIVSIQAYAETVSTYDPETAAKWAMTLPAGTERDRTLKIIHQNWPPADSAGKDAFAREHEIK